MNMGTLCKYPDVHSSRRESLTIIDIYPRVEIGTIRDLIPICALNGHRLIGKRIISDTRDNFNQ